LELLAALKFFAGILDRLLNELLKQWEDILPQKNAKYKRSVYQKKSMAISTLCDFL
jgi:hypothetical protein